MALPVIDVPKFDLTIPGTDTTMEFRPFLVKEDKLLTIAATSDDINEAMNTVIQIVQNCSFGNLDPKELSMYQLQWLFLQLRSKSVGGLQDFVLICGNEECGNRMNYTMELKNFEIIGNIESPKTRIKVNDSVAFTLKYPNVSTQMMMHDLDDHQVITSCLDAIFTDEETIDPKDESTKDLEDFIESLPISVIGEIKLFIEGIPYLGHNIEYTCPKCETENTVSINGYEHFFG